MADLCGLPECLRDFCSLSTSSCPKLPILMRPQSEISNDYFEDEEKEVPKSEEGPRVQFLSLTNKGIRIRRRCSISFPEANNMLYRGSKGWLIMVDKGSTNNMCLLHPITRVGIPLPKFPSMGLGHKSFSSAVLSASPSPSETLDYVVMVAIMEGFFISPDEDTIYTGFWKPGNQTWTKVDIPCVEDLNYYNGKFYAVTHYCEIWMCDVLGPNPTRATKIVELQPWCWLLHDLQLVECGGKLLTVAYINVEFKYKVEMIEIDVIKGSYSSITYLGSWAVFFGRNEGFSIDANRFPGIIKPNSIYYEDGSYEAAKPSLYRRFSFGSAGVWLNF